MEKATTSQQELESFYEQLKKTTFEREGNIEQQILAKKDLGISESQLKEFKDTFNFFDKSHKTYLKNIFGK